MNEKKTEAGDHTMVERFTHDSDDASSEVLALSCPDQHSYAKAMLARGWHDSPTRTPTEENDSKGLSDG